MHGAAFGLGGASAKSGRGVGGGGTNRGPRYTVAVRDGDEMRVPEWDKLGLCASPSLQDAYQPVAPRDKITVINCSRTSLWWAQEAGMGTSHSTWRSTWQAVVTTWVWRRIPWHGDVPTMTACRGVDNVSHGSTSGR